MTDRQGALLALLDSQARAGRRRRSSASTRCSGTSALVLDKWFALQAGAPERDGRVFERVQARCSRHPDFTLAQPEPRAQPDRRAAACATRPRFHRADGAGYVFWADRVLELDAINPQLAARMARALDRWSQLAEPYRSAARDGDRARRRAAPKLSDDMREIVVARARRS